LIIGEHHFSSLHDTGVLLACFTIDYRVLFEPLTEEITKDGFQYYKTFYYAPPGIKVRHVFVLQHKLNDTATGAASWSHWRWNRWNHHETTSLGRECDVL
jgi:hypothetical protein